MAGALESLFWQVCNLRAVGGAPVKERHIESEGLTKISSGAQDNSVIC